MVASSRMRPSSWAALIMLAQSRAVQAISIADLNILGTIPLLTPATCVSAIKMDLPGCTEADFNTGCSPTCAASVQNVRTTVNSQCGSGTGLLGVVGSLISTINTQPLQALCQVVINPSSAAPTRASATAVPAVQSSAHPQATAVATTSTEVKSQQQTPQQSKPTSQPSKEAEAQKTTAPTVQSITEMIGHNPIPTKESSTTKSTPAVASLAQLASSTITSLAGVQSTQVSVAEAPSLSADSSAVNSAISAVSQITAMATSSISPAISTDSMIKSLLDPSKSPGVPSPSGTITTSSSFSTATSTPSVSSAFPGQQASIDSTQPRLSPLLSTTSSELFTTTGKDNTGTPTSNAGNIAVVASPSSDVTVSSETLQASGSQDPRASASTIETLSTAGMASSTAPPAVTASTTTRAEIIEAPASLSSATSVDIDTTHTIYQGFAEVTGTLSAETFSPAAMKRNQGIAGAVIGTFLAVAAIIACGVYFFLYKPRRQQRLREENYVVYQSPDRPAPNNYEKGFYAFPPRPMRTMSPTGDMIAPPRFPPAAGSHYSLVSRLEEGTYLRSESATSNYEVSPITPQRASVASDYSTWYAVNGFDMYLPRRPAEEHLVSDDEEDEDDGLPYITPLQPVLRRSMSTIPETQELDGEDTCIYELPGTQAWPTATDISMKKAWT